MPYEYYGHMPQKYPQGIIPHVQGKARETPSFSFVYSIGVWIAEYIRTIPLTRKEVPSKYRPMAPEGKSQLLFEAPPFRAYVRF